MKISHHIVCIILFFLLLLFIFVTLCWLLPCFDLELFLLWSCFGCVVAVTSWSCYLFCCNAKNWLHGFKICIALRWMRCCCIVLHMLFWSCCVVKNPLGLQRPETSRFQNSVSQVCSHFWDVSSYLKKRKTFP